MFCFVEICLCYVHTGTYQESYAYACAIVIIKAYEKHVFMTEVFKSCVMYEIFIVMHFATKSKEERL